MEKFSHSLMGNNITQASSAASHLFTYLKRGDTIQIKGQADSSMDINQFAIIRI